MDDINQAISKIINIKDYCTKININLYLLEKNTFININKSKPYKYTIINILEALLKENFFERISSVKLTLLCQFENIIGNHLR